ncbi:MAG TPA: thiamine pyrophosphate-dependent enzyme, partial [Vicinamibacterales bacterium]|nr:thiamine pyrophosphate-dependent enzyme [Vicinamibacterales bacterium]
MSTLADRLMSFVVERYPFALPAVRRALESCDLSRGIDQQSIEDSRPTFCRALANSLGERDVDTLPDTTPGVTAAARMQSAHDELVAACDGFLIREAIAASLTADERREILRGMILTRALDNRLKQFFLSGEITYRDVPFQGKGFRSLGQEAIYAAGIRLKRGSRFRDDHLGWQGDIVGPIIRDLGIALAMRPEPATVRMVLNAQMAKAGPPMDGRDLHIGDWEWGILPATAPLSISTLSIAGIAMAFLRAGRGRVALSFIGEGGSSLGEWHEAINLCAARRLPAIFCIENNQTALSTSVSEQSAARVFADKAAGYGIPGITIDGTDPDQVAAAFTWAADRARAGAGPALIELVSMRMSGHAHHDDMLFLGKEPPIGWDYPKLSPGAYADAGLFSFWAAKDPITAYAKRLEAAGIIAASDVDRFRQDASELVENQARAVIDAPWPEPADAGTRV